MCHARLGIKVPVSQGNLISRTLHDKMLVGQSLRIECEHCGHEAGSKTHTADDIKAVAPNTNTTYYTSRLLYNRFRQNRLRYYMENRNIVHHKATAAHTGILYITENRNFVQH